jgi:hypothetical protein
LPASSSDGFLDARCVIVTGSRALAVNIRFQDGVTRSDAVVLTAHPAKGFLSPRLGSSPALGTQKAPKNGSTHFVVGRALGSAVDHRRVEK